MVIFELWSQIKEAKTLELYVDHVSDSEIVVLKDTLSTNLGNPLAMFMLFSDF